ncbi:MAG: MBL fold metallo-hydrolase [Bacteroidia bacterium]
MRITFLGTGTSQGVPLIGCPCGVCASSDPRDSRLRSSILVQDKGKTIVVDTGPDFRQQMLRNQVKELDAVLFTHEHKDHVAGMDDIRAYNFILQRDMPVYATERVQQALRREFVYIFDGSNYPGIPKIQLNTIENRPFEIEGIAVVPIEVMHYKLPVLGFRFDDFAYITDANYISEEERQKIRGCKVLVLNALRREAHISHFTLEEAIELVEDLKPKKAYFTHISHQMGFHEEVEKELPAHIRIAFDGLTIEV